MSKRKRCRHSRAWPTTFGRMGFMWCPDCGSVRVIERSAYPTPNNPNPPFGYYDKKWRQTKAYKEGSA